MKTLEEMTQDILQQEEVLRRGGHERGHARQQKLSRLSVRDRLHRLLDDDGSFIELGVWAGYEMYSEWGEVPAAGVITVVGSISGRLCMVVANDATVKAGAFFPQTVKKVLRAQRIAFQCRLPLVYLVDSAGVFLPMQDEIFPDEDDFGRIFRNNAVLSAAGIPQYAAIMGHCVAGGAYLPVLCDKIVMTEGSALYLAGPALVKAAIGQDADEEELGGAQMHSEISGTVDFKEPNDEACVERLRSLVATLPGDSLPTRDSTDTSNEVNNIYNLMPATGPYDVRDLLRCIVDRDSIQEYKADYGQTLVNAYARIGGTAVGIVASQKLNARSPSGEIQIGGVLYPDSVEKTARFIMDCNQSLIPLVFFQDVQGFMVGRDAEQAGIIRSGAKLVNVISNSVVPKITVIIGGSFGAGNYALCGKAFDPCFIFAWPNARYAVMGPDQAAETVLTVREKIAERRGEPYSTEEMESLREEIRSQYSNQSDIRYAAARGWVDGILAPHRTREFLILAMQTLQRQTPPNSFQVGVLQV